jgi:transposase InsO family protein
MKTSLISDAIDMAAGNITLTDGCVFHSDRGSQYTSQEFRKKLDGMNIKPSVGRTGVCWYNAMAESFFGALNLDPPRDVRHVEGGTERGAR